MAFSGETEQKLPLEIEDEDDDDLEETLSERLWGLTEMLPEVVRNSCSTISKFSWGATKFCFSYGRSATWLITSSFMILVFPVVIENQRELFREEQEQQQRQILLGPNAATSGYGGQGLTPGLMPPPQQA